jgi:hypothetical protein
LADGEEARAEPDIFCLGNLVFFVAAELEDAGDDEVLGDVGDRFAAVGDGFRERPLVGALCGWLSVSVDYRHCVL